MIFNSSILHFNSRLESSISLSGEEYALYTDICSFPVQYDTDVVTWSPQGRIFQIEYAMEAVKQGSAAVGLKVSGYFT
jgi:hypothetical protein